MGRLLYRRRKERKLLGWLLGLNCAIWLLLLNKRLSHTLSSTSFTSNVVKKHLAAGIRSSSLAQVIAANFSTTFLSVSNVVSAESVSITTGSCKKQGYSSLLAGGRRHLADLAHKYPKAVIEHDFSDVECDVVLIAAGFPRSGSTMQATLLAEGGRAVGARVIESSWQLHLQEWSLQNRSALTEEEISNRLTRLMALKATIKDHGEDKAWRPTVLVMKSHQFDPKLLNVCRHQLVYTSHRGLVRVVASFNKLGWVNGLQSSLAALDANYVNYACWRHESDAQDWGYEDMMAAPVEKVREVAAALTNILGLDHVVQGKNDDVLSSSVQRNLKALKGIHFGVTTTLANEENVDELLPSKWIDALKTRYGSSRWFDAAI